MLTKIIGVTAAATIMSTSGSALASPKPILEKLFTANQTLGGRRVDYPEGKPEMRFYRITLPVGAKIPLHTHPSPVIVYVHQGTLTNVRLVNGIEITDEIPSGSGFLEGSPEEPHYVVNNSSKPVVSFVTFASVEGMPNLIKVNQ